MIKHCFILFMISCSFPNRNKEIYTTASEATMTSTWLAKDWTPEKGPMEVVSVDKSSGCICRLKPDHHIVCYGSGTCTSFPKNMTLPPGVYDIRIKTTNITKCAAGDLSGFTQIVKLEIVANFRLIEIEPGFFAGMKNLINLTISSNRKLKYLHRKTFEGLLNLKNLKLIKNGFNNIFDASTALQTSFLPNIHSLSLSENVFTEINETSFEDLKGTGLRELDLVGCQIEKIHPNALKSFIKLEKLRIGKNKLTEEGLKGVFEKMISWETPLRFLNLHELGFRAENNLTSLLEVIAELNITYLNLRGNTMERLYKGLFPVMPNLETLDIRDVSATNIEPNALNLFLMPKLKSLLLAGNRFSELMPGFLLPQLSELDLSANTGSDSSQNYFDVNSNVFKNMTKLESLNLSHNRVSAISNETFNGVYHLKVLGLKNATIFYIAENSFLMLKNLILLNLDDNPFSPFNNFSTLIFNGLVRLETLLLSSCGITNFNRSDIFEPLIVLKYLNLKGNKLISIDPYLLRPLHLLAGIDLSSNELTPWEYPHTLFSSNSVLKVVLLSHNRFTHLTTAMLDDLSDVTCLDLSGNPYVCDFLLMETIVKWMYSYNGTRNETNILDSSNVCLSPDEWRDKPLIEFLTFRQIDLSLSNNYKLALGIVILAIIICLVALAFLYRSYLNYWIFLAKSRYFTHKKIRRKVSKLAPVTYKYDAFVSYSHEDRNFVVGLVSKLENEAPYLKLCVYERDFEIGTVITETIFNKLKASRKMLLVVSNSFVRSQWCKWELQLAEYHRIFQESENEKGYLNDFLIIIRLGPITECLLTPILNYIMKTRIYLEWSPESKKQKIFWNKLRQSLTIKRLESLAD